MVRRHIRTILAALTVLVTTGACPPKAHSQHWSLGGNAGMSMFDGYAGFHLTPVAEFFFHRSMAVGSELSINTQYGAPLLWYPYFKYQLDIHGSRVKPYGSVGPVLALNVPNGPCFGLLLGAGINIPVAPRLSLAPNVLAGPVFGYGGGRYPILLSGYYWGYATYGLTSYSIPGTTAFAFSVRAGIRYDL